MANPTIQPGAAPANAPASIALAEQFMEIGGRLLINPKGRFEPRIDVGLFVRSDIPQEVAATRCSVARAFLRMIRRGGAVTRIKRHIRERGQPAYGWLVLEVR